MRFFGPQRRAAYRTATFIGAAALVIGSLQPRQPANLHFSTAHHVAHLLGFGALAFLAIVGFSGPSYASFWPAAASFLLGFAIEFLQHLQNRKPVEWHDVRDDGIGILLFTVFCHLLHRRVADEKKSALEWNELLD